MTTPTATGLLDVRDLTVEYRSGRRRPPVRAVDGVSFSIAPRETVGLVGESGSGKSTIGRAILGLTPIKSGTVALDDADIGHASPKARRELSARLQVVFQDPYSSLNPARTIGQTLSEALRRQSLDRHEVAAKVGDMLERVGLPAAAADRYPAQFSGGQRQRIAIARALIVRPALVICDEAVSALDLSVQAQVLNLLRELQGDFDLGYLFISHDLTVVRHVAHRVVVLYGGRIMESGPAATVHERPAHPYSKALLAAAPVPDPDRQRARRSTTAPQPAPSRAALPNDSCNFAPRCPFATDVCRNRRPTAETTPEGVTVSCHRWRELRS
ncbi:oligopeptide/dipeptide ABC transporter ATP-binding protein [Thermomonospora umbrina]|uniref:Glutathione import ATP-binding protein GsiA n=1 Tax=Thermomonospora umbrina TaxID=111806 RepID=A0A3D9T0I1_9ACTN|nr:ABC transporter ATP-binding protein [Thermomonospora umbrina]REE98775.1 oligopeptide/dipeptide ABC transporter ATP-binding protein [Thermomonospora umbrina]